MIMSFADEDETLFEQIKEYIKQKTDCNITEMDTGRKWSFRRLEIDFQYSFLFFIITIRRRCGKEK